MTDTWVSDGMSGPGHARTCLEGPATVLDGHRTLQVRASGENLGYAAVLFVRGARRV